MTTLFPCYSPLDFETAAELAIFLETGAAVQVFLEDGALAPGEDLVSKAADAQSAEVILVLLSSHSTPLRQPRAAWERAFIGAPREQGIPIAFVLLDECKFPELLRRCVFFDLRGDRLAALRDIKRWVRRSTGRNPVAVWQPAPQLHTPGELAALGAVLADRPGNALLADPRPAGKTTLALAFARKFHEDFDALLWAGCGVRSLAEIAGDLAAQLGLRLSGEAPDNAARIRAFCAERRLLLVLDDLSNPEALQLVPGGQSSTLVTSRSVPPGFDAVRVELSLAPEPASPALDETGERLLTAMCACAPGGFSLPLAAAVAGLHEPVAGQAAASLAGQGWILPLDDAANRFLVADAARRRVPWAAVLCAPATAELADLQHWFRGALRATQPEAWTAACQLARRALALARQHDRLAEAFELMRDLHAAAQSRQDFPILRDTAREQVWILEQWDRLEEARLLDWRLQLEYEDQLSLDFGF